MVELAVNKRLYYVGVFHCPLSEMISYWPRYSGADQCPLLGVERCISSMVKSFGGK